MRYELRGGGGSAPVIVLVLVLVLVVLVVLVVFLLRARARGLESRVQQGYQRQIFEYFVGALAAEPERRVEKRGRRAGEGGERARREEKQRKAQPPGCAEHRDASYDEEQ
jgi:predicted Holliday junction resolvase-like endonuclease